MLIGGLFKLGGGKGGWLFSDSFSGVEPYSLPEWYSSSDWWWTGVGSLSSCCCWNCCLRSSTSMIIGNSLIKGLSNPKVSLR